MATRGRPLDRGARKSELTKAELNSRLYDKLVDLVGTEEEIRLRQQAFKIMDTVNELGDVDSFSISSGSLPEGLDLKGSDEDMLLVLKFVDVAPCEESVDQKDGDTQVSMEMDVDRPGYAKLFLVGDTYNSQNAYIQNSIIVDLDGRRVLSSSKFRDQFIFEGSGMTQHGPCISDGVFDIAMSLAGNVWPREAKDRLVECRSEHWISEKAKELMLTDECIYVPVGPRSSENYDILWRVSLCRTERKLTFSMNHVQMLLYGLFKIVLKEGIERIPEAKDLLCSYFMKTCLFWLIDETNNDGDIWSVANLFPCYEMCLDRLIQWVTDCKCPNYIIPGEDMFFGKVHDGNREILLSALKSFRNRGYEELTRCDSFASLIDPTPPAWISQEKREAKLDFICYRVIHVYPLDSMELLRIALEKMDEWYDSESHQLLKGVINKLRASLNQELAQMLHVTDDPHESENIRAKQQEHLLKACNSDVCCGAIFLASFYHKQGHHDKALEILNTIIQKLTPSVILLRRHDYSDSERENYVSTMCGQGFTLEHKMKSTTAAILVLLDNSSLIPDEFQPEVQNHRPLIMVPPAVFVYALKFLCYHHLKDKTKERETLRDLEGVVERKYLIIEKHYSEGLTILGACYETIGDQENAIRCYKLALGQERVCKSVSYRLDRLTKQS